MIPHLRPLCLTADPILREHNEVHTSAARFPNIGLQSVYPTWVYL
jgi:hypothetical protein